MSRFFTYLLLLLSCLACSAQEQPESISLCDLWANASRYNGRIVKVSGDIHLAFEAFIIADPKCDTSIWLLFGGDVSTPTSSTWNDINRRPGSTVKVGKRPIPLLKDAAFQEFFNKLIAKKHFDSDGSPCYDCYFYKLSATIIGRFFVGNVKEALRGYGHLGCCSLLTIEQVVASTATRTTLLPSGDYFCSDIFWLAKENRKEARELQKWVNDGHQPWRLDDVATITEELLAEKRKEWGETNQGRLQIDKAIQDKFEKVWAADINWVSLGGLTDYRVSLVKPKWLKQARGFEHTIWLPTRIIRHKCEIVGDASKPRRGDRK